MAGTIRALRACDRCANVWSFDPAQTQPDDAAHGGSLVMPMASMHASPRNRAPPSMARSPSRARPPAANTTRIGADLSIPVTPTAAIYATLHPDYSNVELDQQTIAPSLPRAYVEMRPFFTQAASYYNIFNCDVCPAIVTTLYTPAIPTPAQGYAFEGKHGQLRIRRLRRDRRRVAMIQPAVLDYTSDDTNWQGSYQHVAGRPAAAVRSDLTSPASTISTTSFWDANTDYSTRKRHDSRSSESGHGARRRRRFRISRISWFRLGLRTVGAVFQPRRRLQCSIPASPGTRFSARAFGILRRKSILGVHRLNGFLDRFQGAVYGLIPKR